MKKILITAIGSFSATCVIESLKNNGYYIVGTDIYPKEWHIESYLCNAFFQCPLAANEEEYISFMLELCKKENIFLIIPLTDLEIDVFNKYRNFFKDLNVILGIPSSFTLDLSRNKFNLYNYFKDDKNVPSIKTVNCPVSSPPFKFPIVAKPFNGRSSEGLKFLDNQNDFINVKDDPNYILQEKIEGKIITVDYVRNKKDTEDFAIPRYELLRTKNGAGLSVKIFNNDILLNLVSYIGAKLDVNGCVCFEFIECNNEFFLIDVNPRFSAGIAFSSKIGYDMVYSHLLCHLNKHLLPPIKFRDTVIVKSYREFITAIDNI